MVSQPDELERLIKVATDTVLASKLRAQSIELIGKFGTHDALLALLEMAANEQLTKNERVLALKYATNIVKSGN
ncbi:hypothetical protein ACFLW0_02520 [Chloroflexota bacterium]